MTNLKSLFRFSNALTCWLWWISCLERGIHPGRTSDKEETEDILLFGCNSVDCSSPTWLLALKIMPRSWLHCHSTSMLYVLEVSFSKSWADLLCLICVFFEPFLYPPQRFRSPSLFHFISTFEDIQLTWCCVLGCSSPQSLSSNSPTLQSPNLFHSHFHSKTRSQTPLPYRLYHPYWACRHLFGAAPTWEVS